MGSKMWIMGDMEKEIRYIVFDYIRGTNYREMYLKVNYTDDTETVTEGPADEIRRQYYRLHDVPEHVIDTPDWLLRELTDGYAS